MTQHVYDEWCAAHDLPLGDVWDADDQVIRDIYRAQYWNRVRGDEVAWPLCLALFDTAVLHGPVFAIEELQLALKVKADGRFGPLTMAALKKAGSLDVTHTILQARDDTYEVKDVGRRAQFYHGHEDRCDRLCDACGVARTVDP